MQLQIETRAFAALAASAPESFHTEVWGLGPKPPRPWAPLRGSILHVEAAKRRFRSMNSCAIAAETCDSKLKSVRVN